MSQTEEHDHDHSGDDAEDHAADDAPEVDQEKAQARAERLRVAVLLASPEALRKALSELPDSALREMALPTGMPAPVLRRASNPGPRLRRITEVKHLALLAEFLVGDVVEDTVEVLGDNADDPTHEQLVAALETIAESYSAEDIRAMLTYVSATNQPAADVCDRILDEDERYAVPDELPAEGDVIKPGVPAPTPISLRSASPEVREARKARRLQEREERDRQAEVAAAAAKAGKAAKRRKLRKANAADTDDED